MAKKKKPLKNTTPVVGVVRLDEIRPNRFVDILCLKRSCMHIWMELLPDTKLAVGSCKCTRCGSKDIVAVTGDPEQFIFSPSAWKKRKR